MVKYNIIRKIIGKIFAFVDLYNDCRMSASIEKMEQTWVDMGSTLPSPFMTMALIPLACLPETRLTNRGLVDCRTFEFIDLVVD